MTKHKKQLIELINKMRAEPLTGDFSQMQINEYNGMVKEMQYHTGVTAFNLDYLAYLQPTACKYCGK